MSAPQTVAGVCDDFRYAAVEELADRNASYWRSIAEAAFRRERLTVEIHCRQVAATTRAAFATVRELGTATNAESGASR
jgi:hypothetical protein